MADGGKREREREIQPSAIPFVTRERPIIEHHPERNEPPHHFHFFLMVVLLRLRLGHTRPNSFYLF